MDVDEGDTMNELLIFCVVMTGVNAAGGFHMVFLNHVCKGSAWRVTSFITKVGSIYCQTCIKDFVIFRLRPIA